MADVFLSYDKRDNELAATLAKHLENSGFVVWWDTRLIGGETFRDAIEKQLGEAKAVVVLWTTHSVTSKWVISEAEHASKSGKLIPLRTADLAPQSIPMPFAQWQTDLADNRGAIASALKRLGVEPRYAPGAEGSLHDRFWREIEGSDHPEDFELYLKEFPEGPHVAFAKLKLARLKRVAPVAAPEAALPLATAQPAEKSRSGRWVTRLLATVGTLGLLGFGAAAAWQAQEFLAQLSRVREDLAKMNIEIDRPRVEDEADWKKSDAAGLIRDWKGYLARRPVGLHAETAAQKIAKRLAEGRLIAKLEGHEDAILAMNVEADGTRLISRGENGQTISWNLRTRAIEKQARGEKLKKPIAKSAGTLGVYSPLPLAKGSLRIDETDSNTIYYEDENGRRSVGVPLDGMGDKAAVLFSSIEVSVVGFSGWILVVDHRGNLISAILTDAEAIRSYTIATARPVGPVPRSRLLGGSATPVAESTFKSTDAVAVASAAFALIGLNRTILVVDRKTGTTREQLEGHVAIVRALAFLADGAMAISAGDDRTIRIWDLSDLAATATPPG